MFILFWLAVLLMDKNKEKGDNHFPQLLAKQQVSNNFISTLRQNISILP